MTLYLSRLILNPRSRQVIAELADAYQMHRTLMRAFPSQEDGGPGRVLFRVDSDAEGNPVILVQSEKQPDWTFLSEKDYLLPLNDNPASKEYNPVLTEGRRLRFLLRANPTVKKAFEEGKPSKRIGIYTEEKQMEWLRRKAESGGFRPDDFRILPRGMQTCRKAGETNTHLCVEFAGVLTVTDLEAFRETIASGIGSAKGFGFGLLSVAPVR